MQGCETKKRSACVCMNSYTDHRPPTLFSPSKQHLATPSLHWHPPFARALSLSRDSTVEFPPLFCHGPTLTQPQPPSHHCLLSLFFPNQSARPCPAHCAILPGLCFTCRLSQTIAATSQTSKHRICIHQPQVTHPIAPSTQLKNKHSNLRNTHHALLCRWSRQWRASSTRTTSTKSL